MPARATFLKGGMTKGLGLIFHLEQENGKTMCACNKMKE